jgi:glycosyltransferase involved in cell wall biosynthesis
LAKTSYVKVSVIVPAFNEERLLGESLRHIQSAMQAFVRRGWQTELIVCDNNSTDRTAEIARGAGANVVFEPVNQIARARNCGAAAASGDWLVFVDADSHPSGELFEDTSAAIISGRCLVGGSTVRLEAGFPKANLATALWNLVSRTRKLLAGSFIFCEAEAFRKVGGFSRELFAGEEIDLSFRFKKLARETGRDVIILHRHPMLTSARKMKLYSARELWWFFLRAAVSQKKMLASREACHPWYDGRR